jgi:pilus assembly protein Flp/PilA
LESALNHAQVKRASFSQNKEHPVIRRFINDETGLELSEYAVAAALVTLAVIAAFTTLGGKINTVIGNLATKIN